MSTIDISELLKVANNQVVAKTGKPMTDVQECILQQALEGKKLKEIRVTGYTDCTIQRSSCPKLWKLLSTVTGQQIRVNTVRLALEKLLKASKSNSQTYGDAICVPQELPERPLPSPQSPSRCVLHNLPAPSCTKFVGRNTEITQLLELLLPKHAAHLISVDGIGGVGKTTLVVEAAYRCLWASNNEEGYSSVHTFDAIIFTSAKECYLTPFGFLPSLAPRRTLSDIFHQIARVLDIEITGASFKEQLDVIKESLSRQRTLLVVDNLETVENQYDVLAFLYELPPTVKAVITTRQQIVFVPVRLTSLPEQDGLRLIQHEAHEKGLRLRQEDCQALYKGTGGIPVAISYAIGQLANGYLIEEVLERMSQATGDVAGFCFESSMQSLREQPAHKLIMALALFPTPALREALVHVAVPEVASEDTKNGLARLRGLSLVSQENNRYSMLPLTREYVFTELKAHSNFECEARERWVEWYLNFSERYRRDAKEWQGQFEEGLEDQWQNLQAVIDWCMAEGRYTDLLKFWRNTKAFTYTRGRRKSRLPYWDERLILSEWLIQAAQQRGDWSVLAEILLDQGWILTAMGKETQLETADELFKQAWELRHHQDLLFQLRLAKNIAVLRIQQQRFNEALTLVEQALEQLESTQLEEEKQIRLLIEIRNYQGEAFFKTGQYQQAKVSFQKSLEYAQKIEWRRAIFILQNWLADIAIKEGDWERSQLLLNEGLRVAEVNRDKCRTAFCQRSLSYLAQAQGNVEEARRWATEALENFGSLGMVPEAEETRNLLQEL